MLTLPPTIKQACVTNDYRESEELFVRWLFRLVTTNADSLGVPGLTKLDLAPSDRQRLANFLRASRLAGLLPDSYCSAPAVQALLSLSSPPNDRYSWQFYPDRLKSRWYEQTLLVGSVKFPPVLPSQPTEFSGPRC